MIFSIFCWIVSIALAVTGSFTFWKIVNWYDFYRPIVLFIGGWIVSIILILLFVDIVGRTNGKMHKEYQKPKKICRFCLNQGEAFIRRLAFIKCEVKHKDKFPKNKRVLVICNHRSKFDNFLITEKFFLNNDIAFITKPSNAEIPFVKRLVHQLGYLPIDRDNPLQSLGVMKQAIDKINNNICSIGVFPEGTRTKDGHTLLPFHEGVFSIALKTKCPIVIFSIDGTEKVKHRWPLFTKVMLDIVGVLEADEYETMTAKALSETVRSIISDNLNK